MHGMKYVTALVFVGPFATGAGTESRAAPTLTNAAAVRSAAPTLAADVRWRRWGWWGPGVAIGGLALAAPAAYYYRYSYAPLEWPQILGYPLQRLLGPWASSCVPWLSPRKLTSVCADNRGPARAGRRALLAYSPPGDDFRKG
jgi:hypothetical protein